MIVGAGAGFWIGFHTGGKPPEPGTFPDAFVGSDTRTRARRPPFRLPRPDQPGWTRRYSADEYGMTKKEFVAAYHRTRHLGVPKPDEDDTGLVAFEAFQVAALSLPDSPEEENVPEEITVMTRIAAALRDAKVPAFGNPVLLYFHDDTREPATWEDRAEIFVGIPISTGANVPEPLRVIDVPDSQAVPGEVRQRVEGAAPEWQDLVARARNMGREPRFPMLVRYAGWRVQPTPVVTFQAFVLLEPSPGTPASAPDP